ncbi:MAG: hypothetical protein WA964_16730, partial [Ilumatobacter sp.]|uniref:hypothetical protein n=1 Tax=Ilumatobacter sp. TaxID=1967498 RepID=UPI003C790249
SSSLAFNGAQLETVLINANDKVTRAKQLCNYDEYVEAAMRAQKWSPDDISVVVEKLVPKKGAVAAYWIPQPCPADVRAFDVQRLTITATEPSGRITRTITMVKSDVS